MSMQQRLFFLDFDGEGVNLPYDTDGDAANFNQAEVDAIMATHQRVSEFFAPFDIDVTTEQPDADQADGLGLGANEQWG